MRRVDDGSQLFPPYLAVGVDPDINFVSVMLVIGRKKEKKQITRVRAIWINVRAIAIATAAIPVLEHNVRFAFGTITCMHILHVQTNSSS